MTPQTALPTRKRLAPPWVIVTCGVAMLLTMVVLFPKASLFQQLGKGDSIDQADSLRVILLRNLITKVKGEKGIALRRDYIRQLGLTGDYAGAFAELDRLLGEMQAGSRDSVLMLEAEVANWALSSRAGRGAAARARLRHGLESLLREGAPSRLAWAAGKAEAGGEYDLALRLYLQLAQEDSLASAAWYRRAAGMAAVQGDCRAAASWLFTAQEHGKGEERKADFLDALRALQACDRLEEALSKAESRIGSLRSDSEVLLFLVNLARSANKPQQAQKYAHLLIKPLAAGPGE